MIVRLAGDNDAARLAELHATRITDGFLPSLGPAFLTRLYRRVVRSPGSFAYVATEADTDADADADGGDGADADDGSGRILGFAAATDDISRLYRSFALHDGVLAGIAAAPRLLRSWRRVLETFRYPAAESDLPTAEILAVAVDETAGNQGVGRAVVDAATSRLAERGIEAVKVVAGADNAAALRLYEVCGFAVRARIEVHEGAPSEVLVWNSSSH